MGREESAMETIDASAESGLKWFVMRDLKRPNAKEPAYKVLPSLGFEVFTPMRVTLRVRRGRRERVETPFLGDLLFVHSDREALDPVVERTPTLQYRFLRGTYREPMTVPGAQMEAFVSAVRSCPSPMYFAPGEVTASMLGRRVAVVGGPLDGREGRLLAVRGSRARRLLVELPGIIAAAVETSPEFIRLL